ncbi:hypothetical protein K469DRAFT_703957 [Zopfia rhizophila CBS 207.26]|uniref:BTB domain-containing protein n=1 Tax=Zopfia rhizophila CBS 207.26 TaxID=1314779 RepID=A0A6A6D7C0_9PEZI|nr:hypothetical protein K469DRAFT_703957 [Zopfia rhizophila CBS 207.26]
MQGESTKTLLSTPIQNERVELETKMPHQQTITEGEIADTITLNIGARRFQVRKSTLAREGAMLNHENFFHRLLVGRVNCVDQEQDGSYFIGADPDLFEHVLRFLHRPQVSLCSGTSIQVLIITL